jgi:hypothetical protein
MLNNLAAMIIEADVLYSALTLLYDCVYESNAGQELIGRKATHPIKRANSK